MTAAPDLVIDGSGKLCVALLLELRQQTLGLAAGTVVHLIATDPAAPLDLPAWCHLTGHHYLGQIPGSPTPTYALRLAGGASQVQPSRPWHVTAEHGRSRP